MALPVISAMPPVRDKLFYNYTLGFLGTRAPSHPKKSDCPHFSFAVIFLSKIIVKVDIITTGMSFCYLENLFLSLIFFAVFGLSR